MDFDTSKYIYELFLPLFKDCKFDPIRIIYVEIDNKTEIYNKNNITFNNKYYKKISFPHFNPYDDNYLKSISKKILMEFYFPLYHNKEEYLVYTGYIFNNKKKVIDKEKFMKSINENTTLRYKLSGLNLLKCRIDWNIFKKATIRLYESNNNKIYDLKLLPDDFNNILNKSKECIWQIELNTPLNIYYINTTKILAFVMSLHERLGKESFVSLLDNDILRLILNKC